MKKILFLILLVSFNVSAQNRFYCVSSSRFYSGVEIALNVFLNEETNNATGTILKIELGGHANVLGISSVRTIDLKIVNAGLIRAFEADGFQLIVENINDLSSVFSGVAHVKDLPKG